MKFLSHPYSQASGSIGGTTYSHNRFGMYVRSRVTPVNPSSSRQQAVRNIFSQLTDHWNSTLTQAERTAWNLYASNVTKKDKMGQDIFITGFNHFVRSNCVALICSSSIVEPGPTIFTLAETDEAIVATISETSQQISLAFNTALDWVGEDDAFMLVLMSKPQNGGRAFIDPVLRVADNIAGDSTTPPTSPQTMSVPFAVAQGQAVFVQCRILRADGRLSEPFRHTSSVVS
ncbi:MAG: hypothetical protein ACYTEX_26145 [Planctomycetota bacterium]|jgi:hypothetical protein